MCMMRPRCNNDYCSGVTLIGWVPVSFKQLFLPLSIYELW